MRAITVMDLVGNSVEVFRLERQHYQAFPYQVNLTDGCALDFSLKPKKIDPRLFLLIQ